MLIYKGLQKSYLIQCESKLSKVKEEICNFYFWLNCVALYL